MGRHLKHSKTRWIHYQLEYHFVRIPKYRRKILTGAVQRECKRLIYECSKRHDLSVIALETDIDHIHVFISAPPRYSPANIANLLKGYTSRMLRLRFPFLKARCGEDQLWTPAYYVGSVGRVSAEGRHYHVAFTWINKNFKKVLPYAKIKKIFYSWVQRGCLFFFAFLCFSLSRISWKLQGQIGLLGLGRIPQLSSRAHTDVENLVHSRSEK